MNAVVEMSPQEQIRALRAQILADVKTKSAAKGEAHGAVVGQNVKQSLDATGHQAHKAAVATSAYSGGFVRGFKQGWSAA